MVKDDKGKAQVAHYQDKSDSNGDLQREITFVGDYNSVAFDDQSVWVPTYGPSGFGDELVGLMPRIDVWNRKAMHGKTTRIEPKGLPYRDVYFFGPWSAVNPSKINLGELIISEVKPTRRMLAVTEMLSIITTEYREVHHGDFQDKYIVEYESLFDLSNGNKINEMIIYNSRSEKDVINVPTGRNTYIDVQDRTCYFGFIGC